MCHDQQWRLCEFTKTLLYARTVTKHGHLNNKIRTKHLLAWTLCVDQYKHSR